MEGAWSVSRFLDVSSGDAGLAGSHLRAVAAVLVALLAWVVHRSRRNARSRAADVKPSLDVETRGAKAGFEHLFSGMPQVPHLQGCFVPRADVLSYSNSDHVWPFENDNCSGSFLALHRASWDRQLDKSGNYKYGYVFNGRSNHWEMRIQMKFKVPPTTPLMFGIELDEYVPLSSPVKRAMRAVTSALKMVVGNTLYHSCGDDPHEVTGEAEKPIFSMPLWAFDQIIETMEDEEPPSLVDPRFNTFGLTRANSRAAFKKKMDDIKFVPGRTYTFGFWSISKFFDNIRWEICGMGPGIRFDFNTFCGSPPVHIVMYTLKPPPDGQGQDDGRHVQSRKNFYFHLCFWSSEKPPGRERLRRLVSGDAAASSSEEMSAVRPASTSGQEMSVVRPTATPGRSPRKPAPSIFGAFAGCWEGFGAVVRDVKPTLR